MMSTPRLLTLAVLALALSGCAAQQLPPYDQVRTETLTVLQQIADLVPEPKEISKTAEFAPYPCDDELTQGNSPGVFFTGQWRIYVGDDFNVSDFVHKVPSLLGEDWREEPLGISLRFAQMRLVRESPRMTLTVEESVPGDRKAVEILGISRCAAEETSGS